MLRPPPKFTLFPYTTLFRSGTKPFNIFGLSTGIRKDFFNNSDKPLFIDNFSPTNFFFFTFKSSRSEEHTSELQSRENFLCRFLLEKKKNKHKLFNINIKTNH